MDWGMQNRLGRLINEDGHCFFLPIDHGYFQGPTSKLEKPAETIKPLIPYADGLFVTRGVLRAAVDPKNCPPIILRVSGGTSIIGKDLSHEPITTSVEEVIRLNAAAVGMSVFVGSDYEYDFTFGWERPGLVAGVDEAGRGPLAGPVVAAAGILDDLHPIGGLSDSKTQSPARRERLHDEIRAKALCCSVGLASVEEIDRLNILQATMLAMRRAVEGLRLTPARVLIDGNRMPVLAVPAQAIVGGDAKVRSISAASIVAKVHRDRICAELDAQHPGYGFASHKGYPTTEHLAAPRRYGPCVAHRRSYAPVRAVLEAARP